MLSSNGHKDFKGYQWHLSVHIISRIAFYLLQNSFDLMSTKLFVHVGGGGGLGVWD